MQDKWNVTSVHNNLIHKWHMHIQPLGSGTSCRRNGTIMMLHNMRPLNH